MDAVDRIGCNIDGTVETEGCLLYTSGDLFDDLFEVTSFFCDQGRVGGNAADYAHVVCLFDVCYIRSVDKKLHASFLPWAALIRSGRPLFSL